LLRTTSDGSLSLQELELSTDGWQQVLSEATRLLARDDVFAFGEYVFGYVAAPHHREMVEHMLGCIERKESSVILEPRGHAKTTWGNTILLSWLVGKNPNLRIGLISNTAKQSNAFSRAIRWTIQSNDKYRDVFGDLVSPSKWTDVEWLAKDSIHHASKDVTMYSAGALGAIISKRFDLILCDDILDEENTANPEQREKIVTWFWKTLKPCLVPGGIMLVLGTRWAEEDLYEVLIENNKWPSIVRGALIYEESDVAQRKPRALWPEVWPVSALLGEKLDMGSAMFACSYLNDISGLMAGNVFHRDWFRYFDALDPDKRYTITMGVDLASSERQAADFTARVVVAEDEQHNHYILSVYRDKRETGHRQFVIDGWQAYPEMSRIVIENNQFQSTLVRDLVDTTNLPVVGKKADVDKVTRARSVAARYESRKVFHHRSMAGGLFEQELLQFPKGHDDMIDALGNAMDLGRGGLVFGSLKR
jgi:predicted phage terminase large subunit-like protein